MKSQIAAHFFVGTAEMKIARGAEARAGKGN